MEGVLYLVGLLLVLGSQLLVSGSYSKYKKIKNKANISGFDVAREILDKNGLNDIHIVETNGNLTDHYDPSRKVVRLSKDIFHGTSIASMAVAAHECGHALQDKDGYKFMRIRAALVPTVNISTKAGYIALVIGLLFSSKDLALFGVALLAVMLLFQLVTLPVEFNASNRAKKELNKMEKVSGKEEDGVSKMLLAAALTYVASVINEALQIFRLLLIASNSNRRR